MPPVSRTGRLLDLAGLALFLVGGALFGRSWLGFRTLPENLPAGGLPGSPTAIEVADGFLRTQRFGALLMLVGVAVFVGAWWMERRTAD